VPVEPPTDPAQLRCSLVVPAHDEGAVLAERLGGLLTALDPGEVEVVVVVNGSTDDTADVARALPGTRVVELTEASKTAALNAGDRETDVFPRIYLDADVRLGADVLRRLAAALDTPRAVVAAPSVVFDTSGSSWPVRAFYRVFQELPYSRAGLIGLGVYGFSASGRRRFGDFPDVVADDLYVQRRFDTADRITVEGTFQVVAPRRVQDLLSVRTRVARGNEELGRRAGELGLDAPSSTTGTLRALATLVARRPALLPAAVCYVLVTALARSRAARAGTAVTWERDSSSRESTPAAGRTVVDGVAFDPVTESAVVDQVMVELAAGRGGRIVTPNVDIHRQLRDPEHRSLLDGVELVVADGMPVVWASRLQGRPLPGRVAGATLVRALARRAAAEGRSVFILGGEPDVAAAAADRLTAEEPALQVAGWHSPPLGFEAVPAEQAAVLAAVTQAQPDIVFVALGFPKQERLMAELHSLFPGSWFVGCGGSVDFIAGRTTRAPLLLQRIGLEWAFRLAQEPRRLARRYLVDGIPHAAGMLARSAAARVARPGSAR
jgi:N-acetylglucosaminyldiphosphoundecaprenol N-acetyl-beta-D-mannosaminyltransferase